MKQPIDLLGFNPTIGHSEYAWGCSAEYPPNLNGLRGVWQEHRYHCEVLSWHYHDYMGIHAFVQVWDYTNQGEPDQRWEYALFLYSPTYEYDSDGSIVGSDWNWTVQVEYDGPPKHSVVGADIDAWFADMVD